MNNLIQNLEQFILKMEERMERSVAEMIDQPMPLLTEEKFALFETTGNRLIYEKEYFGRRRLLALFGVAALRMQEDELEELGGVKREDICKKLEDILMDICQEECWALPAHVNRKDGSDWRNVIDLFASETADALAYLGDMLCEWLSEECCNTIRENVKRRILDPFFTSETGRWHWEQSAHNWNAVCNGSIGAAYLHNLADEEEGNGDYIERICDNLGYFIDGYAEDGTCMEGLGYYDYGMTYFTNFVMELYDASAGHVDMLCGDWDKYKAGEKDKRSKIAQWWCSCFFKSGRTISFSDGASRGKFRMGLASALALRFPEVQLPDFKMAGSFEEDHCARFTPYKMDYFFTRRYLEQLKEEAENSVDTEADSAEENAVEAGEFIILNSAQWCIGKAANGVGLACKGGHNREPHNHNDIGSFLYVVGEDMLLEDLGAGEYTKEYFGPGRYNVFCNQSFSHNVPIVAGQGQMPGREYRADLFEAEEKDGKGIVNIKFASAYQENLIQAVDRCMVFDKQTGVLEVKDQFAHSEEIMITENLITRYAPEINEDGIMLSGDSGACKVTVSVWQDNKKTAPDFQVYTKMHSNHSGVQEQIYQIQWDVLVNGQTTVEITVEPKLK